jgi:IS30 family transposase
MDKHKGPICFTERLKIEENLKANLTLTEISKKIGRAMSTLYAEIMRGGGYKNYSAAKAHEIFKKSLDKRSLRGSWDCDLQTLEVIKKLLEEGKSCAFIACEIDVDRRTLLKYLRRTGLLGEPLEERLEALEMQVEIILEQLEKMNVRN